jgi:UDP-N-acetylmuramoyl-tripeptide--D-alanyl-D-alanine ligase
MKRVSFNIEDFFQLKSAVLYDAEKLEPISQVTIDSRNVPSSSLFIAIKGEKFDGHDFLYDAVKKGASAVLINDAKLNLCDRIKVPIITVKDTTLALGQLSGIWRDKLRTKIICITGSAGKTTTKEIIFTLLSGKYRVNKTLGNNNNHIGVPLTLLSTTNKHDFLVLELGTNHFGEIKYTAEIAKSDYAMITNIGNSHLEFLKNRKGVLKEKSVLFDITESRNGTLFINNNDSMLANANSDYRNRVTFGLGCNADVKGEIEGYTKEGKPIVQIEYKRKRSTYNIPAYGEQGAKNFLAATAISLRIGLRSEEIKKRIAKIRAVDKRLNIQRLKDFILINDTYNANPDSMKMSLELLSKIKIHSHHIAILGDMFELGKESRILHEKLSTVVVKNKIDCVYTIGGSMKFLHEKLKTKNINTLHFNERDSLKKFLTQKSFADSAVLIKGSRGMKMEEFAEIINTSN